MKPVYFFKLFILSLLLLGTTRSNAQMVGTDVFLKGQYVEIGMASWGWYGSGAAAPAGYHPHGTTSLGFVADPAMDGWAVGSPAYFGDFFTPGMPSEGWELQINGPRCSAFNPSFSSAGGLTSGVTPVSSYGTSGTTVYSTWTGVFDSVQMVQVTTLDTTQLYFTVKITLTNLSVAPKNNIYYFRSVDPDNDETWPGGSFVTRNKIEHQATDTAVVSATGNFYTAAYLALGTTDTNSTALIYNSWPVGSSVDLGTLYNGTFGPALYAQGAGDTADVAIGLVIKVPHLATVDSSGDSVYRTTATYTRHPANSASFTYFYSFSPAATDSAIKKLHQSPNPGVLAINNVNTVADIKVYPNPAKDFIVIRTGDLIQSIQVFTTTGQMVFNQALNARESRISTSGFKAGLYTIQIETKSGKISKSVVIEK